MDLLLQIMGQTEANYPETLKIAFVINGKQTQSMFSIIHPIEITLLVKFEKDNCFPIPAQLNDTVWECFICLAFYIASSIVVPVVEYLTILSDLTEASYKRFNYTFAK